jgi:hypothetical protein
MIYLGLYCHPVYPLQTKASRCGSTFTLPQFIIQWYSATATLLVLLDTGLQKRDNFSPVSVGLANGMASYVW